MPLVEMEARVSEPDPGEVLRRVADFESWPERSDDVRSCRVEREDERVSTSYWETYFRRGILRWSQRDEIDLERAVLEFALIEGDPVAFEGSWRAEPRDGGSRLLFSARFDLGIDTLAHVLDPLAIDALEKTLESVVRGVVDAEAEIEFSDDLDEEPDAQPQTVAPRG